MSYVTKSPWIIHYDGSSCNGCDIEVLACLTPMYDAERFGIINTGNPKHADIFLVTGSVNEQNISVIKQIYEQMPRPKVVVAVGICANSGGVFKECYNIMGGVDTVIPVDVYVPGCAARPEAIIDGIVKGLGVLAEKRARLPQELSEERAMERFALSKAQEFDADAAEELITVEVSGDGGGPSEKEDV
jgi:ech hydrogenase subunit C